MTKKTKSSTRTRAIGLDISLGVVRWLTGHENLHYGYWDGLEVSAANLGRAQEAYTDLLFGYLPEGPQRILDIGGGAGETAAKLIAAGHEVEIVIPSAQLAERCRVNAPGAIVHECRFEDFKGTGPFDTCLFSESFQYIPMEFGLSRCLELLKPGGHVVLADCFRSENFKRQSGPRIVGGGFRVVGFRAYLETLPYTVLREADITASVAPSVEIEQGFYTVIGDSYGLLRADFEARRPRLAWILDRASRLFLSAKLRGRLRDRFLEKTRTSEAFCANNRYLLMALRAP